MKRKLFLILSLFLGLMAQAQNNISVASFRLTETDLTAITHGTEVKDQNGNTCALIKVETTQTGFTFDVGMMGVMKTEQHTGEIWVYVPFGVKKITIQHQQLGTLRDYYFPCGIEQGKTYIMQLTTGRVETVVTQNVSQQYLFFKLTPADAVLEVNDQMWSVSSEGTAKKFVNFGTYDYRVQAANYYPEVGKAIVNNPNDKTVVNVNLKPNFGWIEVPRDGDLQGASVYVDNSLIGKAPVKSDPIKSGQHIVKIVKDLYEPYSGTIVVKDNETSRFSPELIADFANVTLRVNDNAEIWINDEKKGNGSWTGNLETGTYKIECKLINHEPTMTSIDVNNQMQGRTIHLEAPKPVFGSLNVESSPDLAIVYIDGKKVGETPMFISQLLVGKHEVKLSKEKYADYTETVTITRDEMKTVNAMMTDKVEAITMKSISGSLIFTVNGVTFEMLPVEGGTFTMGATSEQGNDAYADEKPTHKVTLDSYYIGKFEVTQKLWKAVMGTTPSIFKGDNLPVENVSWIDCQMFIKKLNQLCGNQLDGKCFALPTEAQWEYAARGGKYSRGYKFSGSNTISDVAWYNGNSESKTHIVGTKMPNELGIYDMNGNVWEWCNDWWDDYSNYAINNPLGPSFGSRRVFRGGCWSLNSKICRVSVRYNNAPTCTFSYLGFRLVLNP